MCERALVYLRVIDPLGTMVDLVVFDGHQALQNAGKMISIHFPRVIVINCGMHVVSCFFGAIMNEVEALKALILFTKIVS